jgi:mRNA-degrading endonuclease toxin of MazEF toxin-antitoxin module
LRRGEIWNITIPMGDRVRPVLVLTNDHANEDMDDHPHACDVVDVCRDSPYAVQLAERDPLPTRWIRVDTLAHYRRGRFIGPPVGILTGATLAQVDRALRDRLDL